MIVMCSLPITLGLTLFLSASLVHADTRTLQLGQDAFLSGDDVTADQPIGGDAIAAGGRVALRAAVAGDAVLAGGEVSVEGNVGEELYAAGGKVNVSGPVGGGARIAAGDVRLLPGSRIGKGLSAAGGRVVLEGEVASYAHIAAGSIRIEGHIAGNVDAAGRQLQLGPKAVIDGTLTFRGPQPAELAPGAVVRMGVMNVTHDPGAWWKWPVLFGVFALVWIAGWAVVGIALLALLPGATARVTDAARTRLWWSAAVGAMVLLGTPIVMGVLTLTVVGIPLALLLLLIYLAVLPLGYLAGVASLSDWLSSRWRRDQRSAGRGLRIGMFLVTLLVVVLVTQIPVLGWSGGLLLWVVGIGALLVAPFGPRHPYVAAGP